MRRGVECDMWEVWDVGCGRWEVRGRFDAGGEMCDVGGGRWDVGCWMCEVGGWRWEVGCGRL